MSGSITPSKSLTLVIPTFQDSGNFIGNSIMDFERIHLFMDDMFKDFKLNQK